MTVGLFDLIDHEKISCGNVRIQIDQLSGKTLMGFIPHHYPSTESYKKGISVLLLQTERSNPNIKSWNPQVRKTADAIIKQSGSYEVILVNKNGFLTEGSRSNLFGIQSGRIITPPLEFVLPGITRQILISLSKENGLALSEKPIHLSEIDQFEAFFISGTSTGVLPVQQVDQYRFDTKNTPMQELSKLYQETVSQYISQSVKLYRKI